MTQDYSGFRLIYNSLIAEIYEKNRQLVQKDVVLAQKDIVIACLQDIIDDMEVRLDRASRS